MTRRRHEFHRPLSLPRVALAALLPILSLSQAWSQSTVKVTAQVVPPTALVGDILHYQLTVALPGGIQVSEPVMPSFDPLTALQTSRGNSFSFINGAQSVSQTYDVALRAAKEGTFSIAPAKVTAGGKTFQSNPVEVVVARHAQETAAGAGATMLEGFISAHTGDPNIDKQIKGKLFLYTELNKTKVVPYEPILAKTYVYKAPGLVDGEQYGFADETPQSGADYLRLEVYRNPPRQWEPVKIGTAVFQRALVEEIALIPTKTGNFDYRASAMGVALPVRGTRRNDPFNDDFFGDPFAGFFGRNRVTADLPPPPRSVEVHPLPQPQPKNYSGIVGDFTVEGKVDRPEVKEGEIVTYNLVFSGTGYADAIPEPALPVLDGFTLFDKKSEAKSDATDKGVNGVKTFEFLLRAAKPGRQTIPAVDFVLFDPAEGKYLTRGSAPINVQVIKSAQNAPIEVVAGGQPGGSRAEIRQLANDIVHIHTGEWEPAPGITVALYARPAWWFLQAVPPAILLLALYIRRRRRFYQENPDLVRRGRAGAEAERRLRKARQFLSAQNSDRFYSEVALAVRGFLGDKLGREPSGLTTDQIDALLKERGADDDIRSHTLRILDACDSARYSLGSDAPGSRQSTYDEAARVLRRLREALS